METPHDIAVIKNYPCPRAKLTSPKGSQFRFLLSFSIDIVLKIKMIAKTTLDISKLPLDKMSNRPSNQ